MQKKQLAVAVLLVIVMLLSVVGTAFAANYQPVDPDDQGKTGILGGDTLAFTEDTVWANLTARWGVRVIFQDGDEWNNAELQNQLLPVTETASANTTAPKDPSHEGRTFLGWERVDENNGSSTLNEDGTVTSIKGPGPIIYRATYATTGGNPPSVKVGDLTVSKTIRGNAASATKPFTFKVTLGDATISGEYGDMTFENGVATFTLKGGESKTASGLPDGVSYIVVESDNDGYQVRKTGDTGTIVGGETATAAFTNTRNSSSPSDPPDDPPAEPKTGSLTISKTVTGTAGEKDKQFTFTVTIGAEGTYNYTGSKSGKITSGGTVQLKHGEYITISGIPADTSYMVAESDNEGYEVIKAGDTGTIAADTTAKADFTNKKDAASVTPPNKPGDPGTPKTGDDSNIALWISLLLASFIGITACIVLFRKKRAGKHMKTFMMLLLVGVMAFSCFGVTSAFAAEDGTTGYTYGQYDMTYLPGTADTVTNMPANETGLTPGRNNPYTVSSTIPQREGFEFIDWMLNWGTMEKPIPLTEYVVKYLEAVTNNPVAPEKTESSLEVGTTVNESAIEVPGYTAIAPTDAELVLAENGNEIIFYYEPLPVLTGYTVKYVDVDSGKSIVVDKVVQDVEIGAEVTEVAVTIPGYIALTPTERTMAMEESDNVFTFFYVKLTDYTVRYLDAADEKPLYPDKRVGDCEVGSMVSESAVDVEGYIALAPTEAELVLAESGNEIIFWYEKQPLLASYTIRYLYTTLGFPDIADPKTVTDVPVGFLATEYAVPVSGYTPYTPSITFEVQEGENLQIIFYFAGDPAG